MIRYLAIINIILIAVGGYLGFKAYGKLTAEPLPATVAVSPEPPPLQREKKPSAPVSYEAITRRNLFNTITDDGPVPEKIDVETLKQTKLNLKLWGTVTGSAEAPYAVIEEKGKRKQNLFRVGDVVQNASIKIILREKVVLAVDGKDEVLEMEKVSARTSSKRPLATRGPGAPGSAPVQTRAKSGERQIALNRGEMETAMQNVNELMRRVRIRPHFSNGKPDGLSFTGIRPNSILRKMGLRNGDVITSVNEQSVENVTDAAGLFQQFSDADGLSLKIKRRGRDRLLKYTWE